MPLGYYVVCRGWKVAEMEAIMHNLRLEVEYVEVPDAAVALVNQTLDEWLRLSDADKAAEAGMSR